MRKFQLEYCSAGPQGQSIASRWLGMCAGCPDSRLHLHGRRHPEPGLGDPVPVPLCDWWLHVWSIPDHWAVTGKSVVVSSYDVSITGCYLWACLSWNEFAHHPVITNRHQ